MRGFVKKYDFNDAAIDIEKLKSEVKLFISKELCQAQFTSVNKKIEEYVEKRVLKSKFS